MNTPPPTISKATTFSLAPGFSRVWLARRVENRFNGFSSRTGKAAEAAEVVSLVNTRLKPGANEMGTLRVKFSPSIRSVGLNEVTTP